MTTGTKTLLERAHACMPGGVSSPVRAFGKVGGDPFFALRGEGALLIDTEHREYIDYVMSWGALMLGHAHPAVVSAVEEAASRGTSFGTPSEGEVALAEAIGRAMPAVEMVRLVNSGTEATMSALRLARAVTGRELVLKFAGGYHGHADSFLVQAGSGVATLGLPDSPGVPEALAALTRTVAYNDGDRVRDEFHRYGERIACVIVEPVCGNAGFIAPRPGFLETLRELTEQHGALLIFDEVMTGFRVAEGGAQAHFGVTPDLTTLGKVMGGGLPVGAYGGQRELMAQVAPSGPVYQAGTLSGNPLATAAGLAQLQWLHDHDPYTELDRRANRLCSEFQAIAAERSVAVQTGAIGAMCGLFFSDSPVQNFEDARAADADLYARFFHACLTLGIFLPPSPFEAMFLSVMHTDAVVDATLEKMRAALAQAIG